MRGTGVFTPFGAGLEGKQEPCRKIPEVGEN